MQRIMYVFESGRISSREYHIEILWKSNEQAMKELKVMVNTTLRSLTSHKQNKYKGIESGPPNYKELKIYYFTNNGHSEEYYGVDGKKINWTQPIYSVNKVNVE